MNSLIDRVIHHYKLVLALVVAITIPLGIAYSKQEFFNHVNLYFSKDDPDVKFYEEFQAMFGNEETTAIVFTAPGIFTPENIALIRELTKAVESVESVQEAMSLTNVKTAVGVDNSVEFRKVIPDTLALTPENLEDARKKCLAHDIIAGNLISRDGTTTAIMFELKPIHSNMEKKAVLNEIMTRTEALAKGKVVLHYSGGACLETEIDNLTRIDNNTFIPITFFLIFAVVYGMLRNLPLALLGQLNITVILIWGMGFMILTGETINMVTVIIAPVLLAISIADSIHILSFYNETYRKNGKSHAEAIAHSAKSLWYPCLFTSATTAVGFLSFLTATVRPVRMVGIFTGIGAMLAFVLTIFALPSLIMAFRKPVEWSLSSPSKAPSPIQRPDRFQAILDTLAKTLVKRYVSISLVFLLITIVLSAGMFKLRFETDFVNFLKQTNKIKQDIIYVENHLRGTVAVELIVHAKSPDHDFTHPESLQQLAKAQTEIYQHMSGYFTTSFSAADYIKEINKAFNGGSETAFTIPVNQQDVVDYYELGDMKMLKRVISPDRLIARLSFSSKFGSLEGSKRFTEYVENHVKPFLEKEFTVSYTGLSALYITMDENLRDSQLRSFLSAFIVIALMMYLICKNVKLTLISIVPNLFPILVTLGIMGWLNIPLDATTIMIASVTIGIAVDDTIHFITWFRRNRLSGMTTEQAIIQVFKDTGKPIVMTSVVLSAAYFLLITGSVKPIIAFGALAGLAMVFALMGDLFILPSLIMLLKPVIKNNEE